MTGDLESAAAPEAWERALEKARHFNGQSQWERAEKAAREGLSLEPAEPDLLFEVARSYVGRDRWDDAAQSLEEVLSLHAAHPQALLLLGVVETRRARFYEAEETLLEVLRLRPTWSFAYVVYGDLMEVTGHAAKAEKLWRKALELDPESAEAHQRLAIHHAEGHRLGRASDHAHAGLALDPHDVAGHASLAAAMLLAGRPFAARKLLRDALRLDPTSPELEEAWIQADRCCRWIYLPAYTFGVLSERLPGKQFLIWGVFVAFTMVARQMSWPPQTWVPVALAYLVFCIYTWIADPLVKLWTKLVPPRI